MDCCHIAGRIGFRGYSKTDLVSESDGAITLSPSNIVNSSMQYDSCTYISWQKYYESPEIQVDEKDILLVKTGSSYGKCALVKGLPKEATINPQYVVLKHITISPEYLTYVLQSNYAKDCYEQFVLGTAIPTFTQEKLGNLAIPLPPLCEQERIVATIQTYLNLIGILDSSKASLYDEISKAKSKILDLAMQGKLVQQDPTDESAADMLLRINPKAKIITDNPHYPFNWVRCRIGDLLSVISGVSYAKNDILTQSVYAVRILRGGNIQDGKLRIFDDDVFVSKKCAGDINGIKAGDTLMVASTGSISAIGKTAYVKENWDKVHIGAFLRILRPLNQSFAEYLGLFFQSKEYKTQIQELAKGSNINNIKASYITNMQIGIPPLNEQKRIVTKIEMLYSVLDEIEASLRS